jgi:PTH1 family peptidyl-tRNA hydrolase
MNAADYVLRRFRGEERELIEPALSFAADAVETWCKEGVEAAMNRFNAPAKTQEGKKGNRQKEGED